MNLATAIRAVVATMRRRPSDFFPFYLLGLAAPAIAQIITFVGLGILVVYLVTSGRLEAFQDELAGLDDPPDPEADPEAFVDWFEQATGVFEPLVTISSIATLILTITLALIATIVLAAAVNAGQLSTCYARLRGEDGVLAGIAGFRRYWTRMLGLYVLEIVLWFALTAAVLVLVGTVALVSVVLAIFVAIFAGLAWLAGVILIRAIFVFAPVAVIVGDRSIGGAIRASGGFIRADFISAVSYYAIAIGVLLGFSGLAGTFTAMGAPAFASLGSFLLVMPALDLLKTVLYGDHRDAVNPVSAPDTPVMTQLRNGFRRGLRETATFVRHMPGYHAISIAALLIGFALGWFMVEPVVGEIEMSVGDRVGTLFAPTAPLYYFSNNWSVAISIGFAGVAAAIPTIIILWINGVITAAAVRLEADPVELLAFVVPHGIIEFPAILIAGALGIHMGVTVWRTWRGTTDRSTLAKTMRRAFWILIGVGILLAIAGVIEGYVSPYYYQPFL